MSLQSLRDASEKLWAKLLMGVLVFSFVGWGAANWILGQTSVSNSLLKIGNEEVRVRDFEQERSRQFSQMSKEMKKNIYSDSRSKAYFNDQIIRNISERVLLEQHASDIGLMVSPTSVANIIKNSPEFWEKGAFSTEKFDAVLDSNGISEKDFSNMLRRQKLREMVLDSFNSKNEVPKFVLLAIYNARNANRKIDYSTIKFDAFSAGNNPTEENLREVYIKNPKMIPEYRVVSYVIVGAKMADGDSYSRGYNSARSIEDMLASGDSMKDAAKKMRATYRTFSPMTIQKETSNGATIKDSIFTDDVIKRLFSMEQGLESEIMEAKNGFAIFRVEKIDPAHAVPFGERRSQLVTLWKKSEQEKQAYLRANEILSAKKKLAVGATVTRTDGAPLEVLSTAYNMPIGDAKIAEGDDAYYIVRVISETFPKDASTKLSSIEKEVKESQSRQLLDDYMSYLKRKYKISVNDRLLKRLSE